MGSQARQWSDSLQGRDAVRLEAGLRLLRLQGPRLGRPFVDSIKGSRHHNMKELRLGSCRALFAFDRQRRAIVLLGGDKSNDWRGWYERNIPVADRLYDQHLHGIGGGERHCRSQSDRMRAAGSGR